MKIDQAIGILENHLYSGKMPSKEHFEALALAVAALKRQRWIPCCERLPEAGVDVLAYSLYRGVVVDYYDGVFWGCNDVTHWMPCRDCRRKDGMGMRLIDADAFVQFLDDQKVKETGAFSKGVNKALNIVISALKNLQITPTVDSVPVVRCRECVSYGVDAFGYNCCNAPGGLVIPQDDAFCSFGQRRKADKNDG